MHAAQLYYQVRNDTRYAEYGEIFCKSFKLTQNRYLSKIDNNHKM